MAFSLYEKHKVKSKVGMMVRVYHDNLFVVPDCVMSVHSRSLNKVCRILGNLSFSYNVFSLTIKVSFMAEYVNKVLFKGDCICISVAY